LLPVALVELVKTTETPVQVLLRVKGNLTGCATLGSASQRLVGGRFEVLLADGTVGSTYAVSLCTADVRPYVKTIPLAVYGLGAGNVQLCRQRGRHRLIYLAGRQPAGWRLPGRGGLPAIAGSM
jgi:hypothetical protein